jgi:hypothetical protein
LTRKVISSYLAKVCKVLWVQKDPLVLRVLRVYKAFKDCRVSPDRKGLPVQTVHLAYKDRKVSLVPKARGV